MKKDEYIKTLNVGGKEIKLGLDDYGQCYFIEWTDDLGLHHEMGLGTYNFNYMEDIYCMFDEEYRELSRKDLFGEYMTPEENDKWLEYKKLFEKEYKFYDEEGTSD